MKVKSLVDNVAKNECFECEHGLSVYIETSQHKILFDMGQKHGVFARNAAKMGVDLKDIDFAVVSHGHFDHGGGLKGFLELNEKAKVFINSHAFEKHFAVKPDGSTIEVGLDPTLTDVDRVILVAENRMKICDGIELFSGVKGTKFFPSDNARLLMADGETQVPDNFIHEQNLVVADEGVTLLIAGCAHNGIQNILDHHAALGASPPTHVIGGFHLHSYSCHVDEDPALVRELAGGLLQTGAKFYTGHCTGEGPYAVLKEAMGDAVNYLAAGDELVLAAPSAS